MLFVAPRASIVGRKKPLRSETIEHLAKMRCACQNLFVWVKGIDAQIITNAQFDAALGHNLHQARRSTRRYGLCVASALDLNDGTDPMLWDRKPA